MKGRRPKEHIPKVAKPWLSLSVVGFLTKILPDKELCFASGFVFQVTSGDTGCGFRVPGIVRRRYSRMGDLPGVFMAQVRDLIDKSCSGMGGGALLGRNVPVTVNGHPFDFGGRWNSIRQHFVAGGISKPAMVTISSLAFHQDRFT
jgi:hypothetical protein